MRPYKVTAETDEHFTVDAGDGKPFRVAKPRLAHSTVERIRKYAKGGEVTDPALAMNDRVPGEDGWEFGPNGLPRQASWLQEQAPAGYPNPDAASNPEMPPPEQQFEPSTGAPMESQSPQPAEAGATSSILPAAPAAGAMTEPPTPGGQAAPAAFPGLTGGMPGAAGQIAAAGKQAANALGQVGAAQTEGFNKIAGQQEEAAKTAERMRVEGEAQLKDRLARQEQMFNDYQNAKIDPRRMWESKSPLQKVGASIGLILGGIGAGLTHGPNYAMQVIDKQIDADMEAQKLNLGKQGNALTHYMQQTNDLRAAQHMMRADYMTNVAAQIQAAANRMQGAVAGPQAQAAIAELKTKIVSEEQAAMQRTQQIQMGNLQMQGSQFQMAAMRQLLQGGSSGGGTKLDPRIIPFLPKEVQERMVPMSDGSYATARSKEDAATVNKSQETTSLLRHKMDRYSALLAQHPNGISQALSPNDYAAAQSLRESMLTDLNGLAGLNRFTHEEAQVFGGRIPDITSKQISGGFQAKMKELTQEVEDKTWEANQQFLNIPRVKRPRG